MKTFKSFKHSFQRILNQGRTLKTVLGICSIFLFTVNTTLANANDCGNSNFNPAETPTMTAFGQSFKICTANATKLSAIEFKSKTIVSEVTGTLKLYQGENRTDAALLHTQSISFSSTSADEVVSLAINGFNQELQTNETYTFFVELSKSVMPRASYQNPYANGRGFSIGETNLGWDFWFNIKSMTISNFGNSNFNPATTPTAAKFGQSFKLSNNITSNANLSAITIKLKEVINNYTGTIKIYRGENMSAQTLLHTQNITFSTTEADEDVKLLISNMTESLSPNETYTFFIEGSKNMGIRASYTNPYADGKSTLHAGWDLFFNIEVNY